MTACARHVHVRVGCIQGDVQKLDILGRQRPAPSKSEYDTLQRVSGGRHPVSPESPPTLLERHAYTDHHSGHRDNHLVVAVTTLFIIPTEAAIADGTEKIVGELVLERRRQFIDKL